jgi:serine/threonine-protein kinase
MPKREPPPPGGPRRAPPGGIWPWLVALLLIVVGGILLAYFLTRDNSKAQPTVAKVSVPALVGFGQSAAVKKAENVGLKTSVRKVLAQPAAGTVTAQSPAAGATVPRGSLVSLTVSKGPPPIQVPNLVGLNQAQAGVTLSQVGLKAKNVQVTATQPSGQVISQKPTAGTKVDKGSTVTVNVSKGPPPKTTTTNTTASTLTHVRTTVAPPPPPPPPATTPGKVPNVIGENLSQALNTLANAGYPGQPKPVKSNKRAGTVVAQSPAPGTKAKVGTPVTISFSLPQP